MNIQARKEQMITRYPGIPASSTATAPVAEVMGHVCGGVIGLSDHAVDGDIGNLRGVSVSGGRQRLGQASVLFRAGRRTSAHERRARRGATGANTSSNASSEPRAPSVRAGIPLRHRRQEGSAASWLRDRGPRRLQALAQPLMAGHMTTSTPCSVRLHDPVRAAIRQEAGDLRRESPYKLQRPGR